MADETTPLPDNFTMSGSGTQDPIDPEMLGAGPAPTMPPPIELPGIPSLPPELMPSAPNGLSSNGMNIPNMSFPGSDTASISDIFKEAQINGVNAVADPFANMKTLDMDLNDPNVQNQFYERYQDDKLGFNPFRNNEELYNKNTSTWNDIQRAGGQWATLTGLGFKDAMGFGDMSDTEVAEEYERAMAIGSSSRGGLGGFTSNLFLNSGYTVGIMGEMIAEELTMAGIELGLGLLAPVTGGATLPGMAAVGALMGARGARGVNKIRNAWKAAGNMRKTLTSLKDVNKAREYFKKGAIGFANVLNPLENTVDFLKNADKLKNLGALSKTAKGFGEFYRDVRNIRLAFGEGALEGGMVQNKLEKDLLAEFKNEHGRSPNAEEAMEIASSAVKAGHSAALWNMPLILLSNKMTFDGLTRGRFKNMGSTIMKTGRGGKILFDPKKGVKEAFEALPDNYFKAKWSYIKNPKNIGKEGVLYTKANIAEGLQELGQESITAWQENYYTAKYLGDESKGGYYSYLASGMSSQMSAQGFETFMSGFLMGGMVAPISKTIGATIQGKQAANNLWMKVADPEAYKQMIADRNTQLTKDVNMLNKFYEDPRQYLSPDLANTVAQKEYQKGMKVAQENGDRKTFEDLRDSSLLEHVSTAIRYGRMETMLERLEDMKTISPEEMKEIGQGLSAEEYVKGIDKSIAQAKDIEKRYKIYEEKYKQPFNEQNFKKGTDEYKQEQIRYIAWEEALKEMVYFGHSFDRALQRQESILAKAKDKSGLKNTPYSEFNVLFGMKSTEEEINRLNNEIKVLDVEDASPESKKLAKKKIQKRDKLKAYNDALTKMEGNRKEVGEEISKEDYNNIKKAYLDYMDLITKENGDYKNRDSFDKVLQDILDYVTLGNRSEEANNAVNTLLDPEKFINAFERNKEITELILANTKNEIRNSLKKYNEIVDGNDMLTALADAGMFFKVEDFEELMKNGTVPDTFYYTAEKDDPDAQVVRNSEDYVKAVGILKEFLLKKGIALTNIQIIEAENLNPYSLRSRSKNKNDVRTYEDLAKQFGFDPNARSSKVPLTEVLEAIINSKNKEGVPYATEMEIALAKKLLEKADAAEFVTFVNNQDRAGEYNQESGTQTTVDARYASHDYAQGGSEHPIEHIILKEEIGRRIVDSLDTDTTFKKELSFLMEEAFEAFKKLSPEEKAEFGHMLFTPGSVKDFAKLAMSNPTFQKFLGTVKTKKSFQDTTWTKFVDLVLDVVKNYLKKRPSGTVLNAALDLITAKIDGGPITSTEKAVVRTSEGEAVTRDMTIVTLIKDHKELNALLVAAFKEYNADHGGEKLADIEKMSDNTITNSTAFKEWFADAGMKKKEDIIKEYNISKGYVTPKEPIKDTGPLAPEIVKAQNPAKMPSYVNPDMVDALEALGYDPVQIDNLKRSSVPFVQNIINNAITAEEAAKEEETEELEEIEERKNQLKTLRNKINQLLVDINDYDSYKTSEQAILDILVTDAILVEEAGFSLEELDEALKVEKKAIAFKVEYDNLELNEYVVLNQPGEPVAKVVNINKKQGTVTVRYMGGSSKTKLIKADKVDEEIKFVSNELLEEMYAPKPEEPVSESDKDIAKETVEVAVDSNSVEAIKKNNERAETATDEEITNDVINALKNECK